MENCLVYQNWLDQIQTGVEDGLDSPPRGTYPNPLCFHWETGNPTLNGGKDSSPRRKFEELKRRAEGLEWYRKSAFLCNIASFFALLFWVILCCSQYTGKYVSVCYANQMKNVIGAMRVLEPSVLVITEADFRPSLCHHGCDVLRWELLRTTGY